MSMNQLYLRRCPVRPAILGLMTFGAVFARPLGAQVSDTLSAPTLHDLAFMTGHWNGAFQGRNGEGVIEEQYTSPSDNVMLGTTR